MRVVTARVLCVLTGSFTSTLYVRGRWHRHFTWSCPGDHASHERIHYHYPDAIHALSHRLEGPAQLTWEKLRLFHSKFNLSASTSVHPSKCSIIILLGCYNNDFIYDLLFMCSLSPTFRVNMTMHPH